VARAARVVSLAPALIDTAIEHAAFDDARARLGELLARYPDDAWAQETRVAVGIHERDWQAGDRRRRGAAASRAAEERWLRVLAVAYREAGEPTTAEGYARRAGMPWPLPAGALLDDPLARMGPPAAAGPREAARRLVAEKRYDEAIDLLVQEIRRGGGDALTYQYLSNAYYEKGDLAGARARWPRPRGATRRILFTGGTSRPWSGGSRPRARQLPHGEGEQDHEASHGERRLRVHVVEVQQVLQRVDGEQASARRRPGPAGRHRRGPSPSRRARRTSAPGRASRR
jgi:tetratricopeptide (TPR) repeat protein